MQVCAALGLADPSALDDWPTSRLALWRAHLDEEWCRGFGAILCLTMNIHRDRRQRPRPFTPEELLGYAADSGVSVEEFIASMEQWSSNVDDRNADG